MFFCDVKSLPVNTYFFIIFFQKCHVFFFGGGSLGKLRKASMGEKGGKNGQKKITWFVYRP